MAGRKNSGLDAGQIEALRVQLASGRKPRVKLSGPQFGPGAGGTVVAIGDPVTDGSDFIRVKVKVSGAMDELAFAPAELTSSVRGAATIEAPAPASPAAPAAKVAGSRKAATPPAATPPAATPPATKAGGAKAIRRKAGPLPKVTVNISSVGADWMVSAGRGARSIAKAVPLPPGVVTAIAKLLDQPNITEAVAEVNDTARAEAEDRAAKLRAELTELEAVLATHRAPR
jgi:hypothetical protein